mmetsp:Transcript_12155/g.12000  ORF Transcript_12155/g.12000 Transcript_12155/m.12000 type:complete len:124 (+) Transcript_12155:63-434(+)
MSRIIDRKMEKYLTLIEIVEGKDFDYKSFELKDHEMLQPETNQFALYKYYNKRSRRYVHFKKCFHNGCQKKAFTKWHNFLDHLRKHTNQKPFKCSHCDQEFTQKSNLKKHSVTVHSDLLNNGK